MAQDLSIVKTNQASAFSILAINLLRLINQANELNNEYFAQQFNSGALNQFVQTDLIGSNAFLTPQILTNVDAILVTLTTTFNATQLNQLRQAAQTPVF